MASRILVVGDPAAAASTSAPASALAIKLALDGYQVQSAADAQHALGLAAWWFPDVVVMALPGETPGLHEQLGQARDLRRAHPQIPLVAIHREEHALDEDEVLEAGFSLSYPVPLDFRELRLGLEWLIRGGASRPARPAARSRSTQAWFSARG